MEREKGTSAQIEVFTNSVRDEECFELGTQLQTEFTPLSEKEKEEEESAAAWWGEKSQDRNKLK